MKKSILLGIFAMMCGGLAAQVNTILTDTLRNVVDSVGISSRVIGGKINNKGTGITSTIRTASDVSSMQMKNFNQLIQDFRRDYDAKLERWDDIYLLITGIRSNPDYYKLSMPATYYEEPIEQAFSISDWKPRIPFIKEKTNG